MTGCSFFSNVGDAISSGYDNTVSYFNAYYNASRLFSQAEYEIAEAEKAARLRDPGQLTQPAIPASARQKLVTVNEKCSNILSFHPESALVDDALLLIGKSYFYQADYLKAERKFSELLGEFPSSSLAPEGEFWRVKTMIRLGRNEAALAAAEILAGESVSEGSEELAGETFSLIGDLQALAGNKSKALESYRKVEDLSSNDELVASSRMKSGHVLFSLEEYARAAATFLEAAELSKDVPMQFGARMQALRSLRQAGDHEAALSIANELLEDFRFSTWAKEVFFERGKTFAAKGSRAEAMDDFRFIDTTSARTEIGAKAAFEMAIVLENQEGDYRGARDAYAKALSYPTPSLVQQARRRLNALTRYLLLHTQAFAVDSLLMAEKMREVETDSAASVINSRIDSLKQVKARVAFELGEIFYAELEKPDSAYFWYTETLVTSTDSARSGRILYVLAELARTYPDNGYGDSNEMYRKLIDRFPNSVFAREAKIQLGMEVPRKETDPAESLYAVSEYLLEGVKPEESILVLRQLLQDFSWSPFAAKSRYAIGWIYENPLKQPDSALIYYKAVIEQHGNSVFAALVRPRLNAEELPDSSVQMRRQDPARKETESEEESRVRKQLPKDIKKE